MRLVCPNCAATYDVPEGAIGPNGRKVRCRACGESWVQTPPVLELEPAPPPPIEVIPQPPIPPAPATPVVESSLLGPPPFAVPRRRLGGPLLLGLVVLIVAVLGLGGTLIAWGPTKVASAVGLADRPVPLGIAITKQPDWRMIAGGSELFAVSGRIWNPTGTTQPIPDIKAELKDQRGRTVYSWTISRPAASLGAGQSLDFDGAAVDVPRESQRIAVSFITAGSR